MSVIEALKDDLGYLKLTRAAECFVTLAEETKKKRGSHLDYLAAVIAEEVAATRARRLTTRLRFARLPVRKTIEEFDFEFQPSVDRKMIEDLGGLDFVRQGMPVLFLGPPGCGKTHLALALALRAVEAGYQSYFVSAADMCGTVLGSYNDASFAARMRTFTTPSLLVIDDVGLTPFNREEANAFYQVVNRRYEKGGAIIVTTNRGLPSWGELFGDPVIAASILDRLMHRAVVVNIHGASYRMREHQALIERMRKEVGPTL